MSTPTTYTFHQLNAIQHVRKLVSETKVNQPQTCGNLSQLFATHEPADLEHWKTIFQSHGLKSIDEIHAIIVAANDNHGFNRADMLIGVQHIFWFDTYFGLRKERVGIADFNVAITGFPKLRFYQDSKKDGNYAVDILVEYNGKLIRGIQCKPNSYFCANPSAALVADKQRNQEKNDKFKKAFGVGVDYLVYDSNTKCWDHTFNTIVATITNLVSYSNLEAKLLSKSTGIDNLCEDLGDDELAILVRVLEKKLLKRQK